MKVQQVSNYNQKTVKNNPNFGNFIVVRLPYDNIPNGKSLSGKKFAESALDVIKNISEEIKNMTNNKVNLYVRSLKDMNSFDDLKVGMPYTKFASTVFIEDNNGNNSSELINVSEYLLKKGLNFETYSKDLFAPKKKGFLEESILAKVAYNAKPKDMVKL